MTYAIKSAIADAMKLIGWRLIRLADKIDPEWPGDIRAGGTD